jgi:hypothetical protein
MFYNLSPRQDGGERARGVEPKKVRAKFIFLILHEPMQADIFALG